MSWHKTLIGPDTSIQSAIAVLDEAGLQICLVVDGERHLLGTVTDGDIRRGILRGVALADPIQAIMNTRFRFGRPSDSPAHLLDVLNSAVIHQLPIVAPDGRVVDLVLDTELHRRHEPRPNWVVLMAGGLGNRLRPLTDDTPKPLLKVGRKPLLETIVDNFVAMDFRRFYISVNYRADQVKDHFGDGSAFGCEIRYLEEKDRLGTAGALSLMPERPEAPFVVMNGDVLTKVNFASLIKFHDEQGAEATMCVREYDFQVPYGVVNLDGDRIASVVEKPVQSFFVNAGIYTISPSALDLVPKGRYFDMPELFSTLIAGQRSTSAFPVREYWIDIGRLDDFERANGEFASIFG
jgi:dTDP-glucose pyrophosphorylase